MTSKNDGRTWTAERICGGVGHRHPHLLDVEARRVAEHDQEEERHGEHHRERAPVAAQLPELLHNDGPHRPTPRRTATTVRGLRRSEFYRR